MKTMTMLGIPTIIRRWCCSRRSTTLIAVAVMSILHLRTFQAIRSFRLYYSSMTAFAQDSLVKKQNHQRWNGSQFQDYLEKHGGNISIDLLPFLPKPQGGDVTIFNRNAWNRLHQRLLGKADEISNNNDDQSTVELCSIGGSTTAGGGVTAIRQEDRYDRVFAQMIQVTATTQQGTNAIQVHNRGHGGETTLFSAQLIRSFVPESTDVIIWDHSLNDLSVFQKNCDSMRNALILFLNELSQMRRPPFVILQYLWGTGTWSEDAVLQDRLDNTTRPSSTKTFTTISNGLMECYGDLAASYDFVVGSVYLASYFDHLQFDNSFASLESWFIQGEERPHPNTRCQVLMAFLLWDLMTDTDRGDYQGHSSSNTSTTTRPLPQLKLGGSCRRDKMSPSQQNVMDIMLHKPLPSVSWTAYEPKNDEDCDGMINPVHYYYHFQRRSPTQGVSATSASGANRIASAFTAVTTTPTIAAGKTALPFFSVDHNFTVISHGDSNPIRQDRKYSYKLPCCSSGERLAFDLVAAPPTTATANNTKESSNRGRWISALRVWKSYKNLLVEFKDEFGQTLGTSGGPTPIAEWTSLPASKCNMGSWPWLVLFKKTLIAQISFCSNDKKCHPTKEDGDSIAHLVLY